jgi:serine/threonine protein kinase
MEKMEKIDENKVLEFRNNFSSFIEFMSQITNIIDIMYKKDIYYTDLKLQNIVYKNDDNNYYLIDYGGLCYPPDFNCESTYLYINETMRTVSDILYKDFTGIKNMYRIASTRTGLSPTTPTDLPSPYENNMQYYLIFLFLILILQIFDDECSLMFYPQKILQIRDFEEVVQNIVLCKNKFLDEIERNMLASNYNITKINEFRKFIKKLFWGEIFEISTVVDFFENF